MQPKILAELDQRPKGISFTPKKAKLNKGVLPCLKV